MKRSPHAKIQDFSPQFFFHPNRQVAWFCTRPFNCNRELKKPRRRRRGQRRFKNEFIFYLRIPRHSRVIYFVYHRQSYRATESRTHRSIRNKNFKNQSSWFTFSKHRRILPFYVVDLQRTVKKCTKNYNARAHPLFCSLNLLFSDVAVAVAVVVISSSLIYHIVIQCTSLLGEWYPNFPGSAPRCKTNLKTRKQNIALQQCAQSQSKDELGCLIYCTCNCTTIKTQSIFGLYMNSP